MRRVALVIALVAASVLAPAASADKPLREPLPAGDDEVFPAGTVCPFTLGTHVLTNREKALTFSDGSQLITGTFKLRLTNLDTGQSIDINASGPARLAFEGDILRVTQTGLSILFATAAEPGGPGALYIRGHVRYDVDLTTGEPLFLDVRGRVTDLCDVLA
jgi:hypothetical protein